MTNYKAILINKHDHYVENNAIEFTFQIYNDQNTLQSSLTGFKFASFISLGSNVVSKYDATYTAGSIAQISISGDKVTVHVVNAETANCYGDYILELKLTKVADETFSQTVYQKYINFVEDES